MLSLLKKYTGTGLIGLALLGQITACNKIPEVEEIGPEETAGQTILEIINSEPKYSILKAAVAKAGVGAILGKRDNNLTLFAPDNDAMARSNISEAVIGILPAQQLAAILSYHVIPQAVPSSAIPGLPLPNIQMPTLLQPLATQPLFKMSIFPSKRATGAFVNNIPITAVDTRAANGFIHDVYALVAPPQATMKGVIAAQADLSFLRAAIARADEGQTGLNRIDSLLNYPFPNITLFAPTDDAFKAALVLLGAPPVVEAFAGIPPATVRGILAYHVLATNGTPAFRVFSPNLVSGTVETLIGPAPMPQLTIDATNPMAPTVKGRINPTASNVVAADIHAVNGVLHKIDQVLIPQM
ncbi:fasciclin domain-containing protein [Flavihumibacter sp. UBA7668]|uniref:fasciclin domain-containing protein n=1 Tax=Flavihumibacter sp. UBA7668 TaxID=1946542 RepID=UPI0025C45322|nr:fasciclin domain-containing protein [Flavihumibacter sp. UBA7668]